MRLSWPHALLGLGLNLLVILQGVIAAEAPDALEREISARITRVEEFKALREICAELKIRCWLFGGTAAGYAHYVKWDLIREHGDQRFQPDRFDYDYTNIYRSTQDADLVVEGSAFDAERLEQIIKERFPYFEGSKSIWEVRLLHDARGDKEALLANPDFLNQHTDSNSTGMIEVSVPPPGESAVRDLRDWNPAPGKSPVFFQDVHQGKLHYYFSQLHESTKRFKQGKNPPIMSVIRYLTKAFQYELEIHPNDLKIIQSVIDQFDPKRDLRTDYARTWIKKNGKKLIQNAVNIEYAWNQLEKLGLRQKLMVMGEPSVVDSLAWWMNKEPLRTNPVGAGTGKTARELGIDIVAHETNNFLAYESITRAHTGDPNVLISRSGIAGEAATLGDGFYTAIGRKGARGTGLTIRFKVKPNAREGTDFICKEPGIPGEESQIVFLNKNALKVIPESLNISRVQYFQMLFDGKLDASDKALIIKLKRRIFRDSKPLLDEELVQIASMLQSHLEKNGSGYLGKHLLNVFEEFLEISKYSRASQILEIRKRIFDRIIAGAYRNNLEPVQKIIERLRPQDTAPIQSLVDMLRDVTDSTGRAIYFEKKAYAAKMLGFFSPKDPIARQVLLDSLKDPNSVIRAGAIFGLTRIADLPDNEWNQVLDLIQSEIDKEKADPLVSLEFLRAQDSPRSERTKRVINDLFLKFIQQIDDWESYSKQYRELDNFAHTFNWRYDVIRPQDPRIIDEIFKLLEFRFNHSNSSYILSFISGLQSSDPALFNRVMQFVSKLNPESYLVKNGHIGSHFFTGFHLPGDTVLQEILKKLRSPDPKVRTIFIQTLDYFGSGHPDRLKALIEATSDPVLSVRLTALKYLRNERNAETLLQPVFLKALGDINLEVRGYAAGFFYYHPVTDLNVIVSLLEELTKPDLTPSALASLQKISEIFSVHTKEGKLLSDLMKIDIHWEQLGQKWNPITMLFFHKHGKVLNAFQALKVSRGSCFGPVLKDLVE